MDTSWAECLGMCMEGFNMRETRQCLLVRTKPSWRGICPLVFIVVYLWSMHSHGSVMRALEDCSDYVDDSSQLACVSKFTYSDCTCLERV